MKTSDVKPGDMIAITNPLKDSLQYKGRVGEVRGKPEQSVCGSGLSVVIFFHDDKEIRVFYPKEFELVKD